MTDIMHSNLQNGPEVISRRTFIKGAGIALAGSALLAVGGQSLLRTLWVREVLPGDLKRSALSQHLGEIFQVQLNSSNVVAMQLAQVRDLGVSANQVDTEHSFSILFRGAGDRPLGQATYQFGHYQIGSFPLFVVPMAPADDGARYYEAVFNRLPG